MPFGFETLLSITKALGAVVTFFLGQNEKQREKVAKYLDGIATTLDAMAVAATSGKRVGRHCVALKTYTAKLKEICGDAAPVDELDELAEHLRRSAAAPGILTQRERFERSTGKERQRAVDQLENAAEAFKVHANTLRAR